MRSLLDTKASSHGQRSSTSNNLLKRRADSAPGLRRLPHASSGNLSTSSNSSASTSGLRVNAVLQIAQRSSGSTVKAAITEIKRLCLEKAVHQDELIEPPIQECAMLSQWSVDAYYKVVIAKYNGLPAIIDAMAVFPSHSDLQAYCCSALKNISNKIAIQQLGGVAAIASAMLNHPHSIHLQSEACEALKSQGSFLLQESPDTIIQLSSLVRDAKEMYLTPSGKESARFLIEFLPNAPSVKRHESLQIEAMEIEITI